MTGTKFRLEGNLQANLRDLNPKVQRGIVAAANYCAPLATEYMRQNASWQDQTGAARNGLNTKVVTTGKKVALVLYHTVPYGVFLEVRWSGKYAIIEPAMAAIGPLFVEAIHRLAFD